MSKTEREWYRHNRKIVDIRTEYTDVNDFAVMPIPRGLKQHAIAIKNKKQLRTVRKKTKCPEPFYLVTRTRIELVLPP